VRTRFTTTIDEELVSKIKIKAIQQGLHVNDIIEELIQLYLDDKVVIAAKK
jgi:predicted DNA binding CopG/RHH family protein